MRFAIQGEKPYLISGGKAYPVEFTENNGVKIFEDEGQETSLTGSLTIAELKAKLPKQKPGEQGEPLTEEEPKRKRTKKAQPLTED